MWPAEVHLLWLQGVDVWRFWMGRIMWLLVSQVSLKAYSIVLWVWESHHNHQCAIHSEIYILLSMLPACLSSNPTDQLVFSGEITITIPIIHDICCHISSTSVFSVEKYVLWRYHYYFLKTKKNKNATLYARKPRLSSSGQCSASS